jgi:hypothetical protein
MLEELLATAALSPQPSTKELAPQEALPSVEADDVATPAGSTDPPPVADVSSPLPAVALSPQPLAQELAPQEALPDVEAGDVATPEGSTDVSLPQSSAHELAQQTPPRVGQSGIDVDETPTPREAARRLARFRDEVLVQWEPPLIVSPPRQRPRTRKPLPIRHRSRRIAAQPLAHIPTSRRGAVLLKQRFGKAPPANLGSPAPKSILDALRSGTLSSSQVKALDAMFPAFNGRASELFIEDT